MNGPSPTTGKLVSLLNVAMSGTWDSQTCWGTTGMSRASIVAWGLASTITSVESSGAVTDLKLATKVPLAVAASLLVIIRL